MPLAFSIKQLQDGEALVSRYRDLRVQLWPDCSDECDREITVILANPARWAVFLALLDNQETVGFLEVSLRDYADGATSSPVAYIEGWFVAAEYRKQGVGKALVQAAEHWAVSRGRNEIASDTQIENEKSIAAHKRLGYKEVERLVCFLKQLEH